MRASDPAQRSRPGSPDARTVRAAVELACRAPSLHNTQPWRWEADRHTVRLRADRDRQLLATDADARDLVLACGAALHHLRIALAAAGIGPRVRRLPAPDDPDLLAVVGMTADPPPDIDLGLAAAIPARRSDRRRFTDWDVPAAFVHELSEHAAAQGAVLRRIPDESVAAVHAAVRDAERAQHDTPGYPTETAVWTGTVTGADGIPAANLLDETDPTGTGRRFSPGRITQAPGGAAVDGAVLLVVGTASDDPLSRLRAGEATSAVLLHATALGLATCPLSQPLEVETTRRALGRRVLDDTLTPQLLLRVGWAPPGPHPPATPRRAVDDVLSWTED